MGFIFKMKFCGKFLYLLCIWGAQHFELGETKSISNDVSDEIYSCDYTRFENKLERLKLQADINHQTQLKQQKELFGKIERQILELSSKIVSIEENLLEANKVTAEKLKDFISIESKPQVLPVVPVVDDKLLDMADIKEKLQQHDQILNTIMNNQNDTQQLIKEIDMDHHTHTVKNSISNTLVPIQKINERLETIQNNLIPKKDQLKIYEDIQQQLNATEKYHNLILLNKPYPTNCANYDSTYCTDNKCYIKDKLYGPEPFLVACNNSVDGGGWTVIQRRINGSVDFYRNWSEYKAGFGNIDGEFFIGLDKLHALTSSLKPVELLIELEDFDNVTKYAKYDDFQIANETENYKLIKLGSYTGNAGDSFSQHVGYNFTTKDRDNDSVNGNCAVTKTGAWWYNDCGYSNLNGKYYHDPTELHDAPLDKRGINWYDFHGYNYSLKSVQMLIRPRKL